MKKHIFLILTIIMVVFCFDKVNSSSSGNVQDANLSTYAPENVDPTGKDPKSLVFFKGSIGNATSNLGPVSDTSLLTEIVYTIATLGLYQAYKSHFQLLVSDNNGDTILSTLIDGQIVPGEVTYQYKNLDFFSGMKWESVTSYVGDYDFFLIPPIIINVQQSADMVCVSALMTVLGYQPLGCIFVQNPTISPTQQSCFIDDSCLGQGSQSLGVVSVSGYVVQCLHNTVNLIFNPKCNDKGFSNIAAFQQDMRGIVSLLLVLYVIFYGIKIALTGSIQAGEAFMFAFKMILVMYFAVGMIGYNNMNGVGDVIWPFFTSGSAVLSSIVLDASSASNYCVYDPNLYNSDSQYLSFFDTLDCKIFNYLGVFPSSQPGALTNILVFVESLLVLPFYLVFSFDILTAILVLIFIIFMLCILIYVTNIFALSIISMAILIYLAPIFVPFALFNQTKSFYENWLRQIMSFALQPVVISAYIALTFCVFDAVYYGDSSQGPSCSFTSESFSYSDTNGDTYEKINWILSTDDAAAGCQNSFGYRLFTGASNMITAKNLIFFSLKTGNTSVTDQIFEGFPTIVLFTYLLFTFSEVVGKLAADITGGMALSNMTSSPMAMLKKVGNIAKNVGKSSGGGSGEGSGATTSSSGGGSGGGGGSGATTSRK